MEGFAWDDLRKILHAGQRMFRVQNGEEILPKISTPWVGRTDVTDDRRICDSKDLNVTTLWGKNAESDSRSECPVVYHK